MVERKQVNFKLFSLLTGLVLVAIVISPGSSAQQVSGDVCQDVSELKQIIRGLRKIDGDTTIKEAGDAAVEVTDAISKVGESAREYSQERSKGVRESYTEFERRVKERPEDVTINEAIAEVVRQVGSLAKIANGLASELKCNNADFIDETDSDSYPSDRSRTRY